MERADKGLHLKFSPVERSGLQRLGVASIRNRRNLHMTFLKDLDLYHKNKAENISWYNQEPAYVRTWRRAKLIRYPYSLVVLGDSWGGYMCSSVYQVETNYLKITHLFMIVCFIWVISFKTPSLSMMICVLHHHPNLRRSGALPCIWICLGCTIHPQ